MKRHIALAFAGFLLLQAAQAQDISDDDLFDMSLEELMNIPISVSKTNLSQRETPAVLSVITRDEIRNMGARDLMDLLNQIPGVNLGVDVQGAVGIGLRGNWGHEGKILLLIDGQEMNETLFSTTQLGQHYDIQNIDKIEIIRGPGSSIYGGYAELGVINIITRTGSKIKGVSAGVMAGATSQAMVRSGVNFSAGNGSESTEYSLSGYFGRGLRSDQPYTDFAGTTVDLKDFSTLNPFMLNAGFRTGNFSARLIYDGYMIESIDQFNDILDADNADKVTFNTLLGELKYELSASDKLQITPRFNFKSGRPWMVGDDGVEPYNILATRIAPSVNLHWTPSSVVSLVAGVDSYFDKARHDGEEDDYFGEFSDDNTLSFFNIGVFGQALIKTDVVNITLGSRVDIHSQFGEAFSPRLGITRAFDKFHFKGMYSRAFRAPALENLNFTPELKPETTGVAEVEAGYRISDRMQITANIFHIQITDPIVYFVDDENPLGAYENYSKAGSVGFEIDYRIKASKGYLNLNYAYATAKNLNEVALYQVPNNDSRVLGFPGGRFNLLAHWKLGKGFSLNPSANFIGRRYGITGVDANEEYVYSELDGEVFINLFLRYQKNNINMGIGVFDLTDQRQQFVQPYAGGHPILPGIGREINLRIGYFIPFN
jgi:outer membrane cobalamin receptor